MYIYVYNVYALYIMCTYDVYNIIYAMLHICVSLCIYVCVYV